MRGLTKDILISAYSHWLSLRRQNRVIYKLDPMLYGADAIDDRNDEGLLRSRLEAVSQMSEVYNVLPADALTNKSFVRENYGRIARSNKRHLTLETSGTTGEGLKIPVSKNFVRLQWAIFEKQWREFDLLNEWRFQFSGFNRFSSGRIHHVDYSGRKIFLSQYALNKNTISEYIKVIGKNQHVRWLHGYPSAIRNLVFLAERAGLWHKLKRIESVSMSSETVTDLLRVRLVELGVKNIIEIYGQTEGVANFFTCRHGSLHVNEYFSSVEFLQSEEGYLIVGSQMHNEAFPFYRYNTGDTVATVNIGCACGRTSRIVTGITGRVDDYLVLQDGSRIGRLDHLTKGNMLIEQAQIVQERKGNCIFKIVAAPKNRDQVKRSLQLSCSKYLGESFSVEFEFVEQIATEKNGKIKFIKSKVK